VRVQEKYRCTLREVTQRLTAIRILNSGERPLFPSGEYSLLISVLESAIDFNHLIPDADRSGVLRKGISDAAMQKVLTPETLCAHITNASEITCEPRHTSLYLLRL
jgi:hypothetical protein